MAFNIIENSEENICYDKQPLEFTVLALCRYFVTATVAERFPLFYGDRSPEDILYVPSVLLADSHMNYCVAFLKPTFDTLVVKHKLKPGNSILVTKFFKNKRIIFWKKISYIEILEFTIKNNNETWLGPVNELVNQVSKFETERTPIVGFTLLNLWFDVVPRWLASLRSTVTSCISVDDVPFEQLSNVRTVADTWSVMPGKHNPLLLRVLCKTKLSWYKSSTEAKNFPTKSSYFVADNTGSCELIIWDNGNTEDFYSNCHIGSVVVVLDYRVKQKQVQIRFPYNRFCPPKYDLELTVESPFYGKTHLQNRNVVFVENPPSGFGNLFQLPSEQYNFITNIDKASFSEISVVDVIGVIVGLSRFSRLTQLSPRTPGRTFVCRCIEIFDPSSGNCFLVDAFANSQVEIYKTLQITDLVMFTFLRVHKVQSLTNFNSIYVTSTQDTEVIVLKHYNCELENISKYSDAIIYKFAQLLYDLQTVAVPFQWIGGLGCYPLSLTSEDFIMNYLKKELCSNGNDINAFLDKVLFWQRKELGLLGKIAKIDYCRIKKFHVICDAEDFPVFEEAVVQIFQADDFDDLKTATVYGSKLPDVNTLPVKSTSQNANNVQRCLNFPSSSLLDALTCTSQSFHVDGDDLMCKNYFRLLIALEDNETALWAIFFPPNSSSNKNSNPLTKPMSLLDLLCLTYMQDNNEKNYLLHHDSLEFSVKDLEMLRLTGNTIAQRQLIFISEAYQSHADGTVIVLSHAITEDVWRSSSNGS